MREARLYERLADQRVHCHLCAHECKIAEGRRGICQVCENRDGTLYTLITPDLNDDEEELRDAARFIGEELGPETPWHISRFHPAYEMTDRPSTPFSTLTRAQQIGIEEGLHHIYVGNVRGESNTVCHECGEMLIRRSGYRLVRNSVAEGGVCPECDTPVAGVGIASVEY